MRIPGIKTMIAGAAMLASHVASPATVKAAENLVPQKIMTAAADTFADSSKAVKNLAVDFFKNDSSQVRVLNKFTGEDITPVLKEIDSTLVQETGLDLLKADSALAVVKKQSSNNFSLKELMILKKNNKETFKEAFSNETARAYRKFMKKVEKTFDKNSDTTAIVNAQIKASKQKEALKAVTKGNFEIYDGGAQYKTTVFGTLDEVANTKTKNEKIKSRFNNAQIETLIAEKDTIVASEYQNKIGSAISKEPELVTVVEGAVLPMTPKQIARAQRIEESRSYKYLDSVKSDSLETVRIIDKSGKDVTNELKAYAPTAVQKTGVNTREINRAAEVALKGVENNLATYILSALVESKGNTIKELFPGLNKGDYRYFAREINRDFNVDTAKIALDSAQMAKAKKQIAANNKYDALTSEVQIIKGTKKINVDKNCNFVSTTPLSPEYLKSLKIAKSESVKVADSVKTTALADSSVLAQATPKDVVKADSVNNVYPATASKTVESAEKIVNDAPKAVVSDYYLKKGHVSVSTIWGVAEQVIEKQTGRSATDKEILAVTNQILKEKNLTTEQAKKLKVGEEIKITPKVAAMIAAMPVVAITASRASVLNSKK